jgi:ABC-type nitrate/sulfonate/bicarbonate transport system permease component
LKRAESLFYFFGSALIALMIIFIWQAVADSRLISPVFLPGPDRAWSSLVAGFQSGDLTRDTLKTFEHMLYGWVLASIIGIAIGALLGSSSVARTYVTPTLEFIRPLPSSAITPVAIAFFGLSDAMVVAVIGFGTMWPMLLSTFHGVSTTEPRLLEVGRTLRFNRMQQVWKLMLPNAVPDMLSGMRLGLATALILAVVGEMLAGQTGLGVHILHSARSFRAADLFAGVIVLGLLGFVSNTLLAIVSRRLLVWREQ